jgi:Tol biopolymer transport system component
MVRRASIALALTALFLALPMHAAAAAAGGPRLAISASDGLGLGAITVGPSGEGREVLVEDQDYLATGDRLSWSADGSLFAFSVSGDFPDPPKAFGTGWSVAAVARSDGSGSRPFPRAFLNAGEPVMAPDVKSLVFQRVKLVKILPERESYLFKSSIWSLDVRDGSVRRLTRWRLAALLEPRSYSPDGSTLAAELYERRRPRAVAIDLRTRRLSLLARNASEPTYSADGTKLAFVRDKTRRFQLPRPDRPVTELWVSRPDGSGARRVLRRKGYISFPSWDPSGSRLSFTVNPPEASTGGLEPEPGNEVMAINADGTCLIRVYTDPELTLYGSAWQPGIGRGAGPISC